MAKKKKRKKKSAAQKSVVVDNQPVSADQVVSGSGQVAAAAASAEAVSEVPPEKTASRELPARAVSKWDPYLAYLLIFLAATPTIVGPYGQKDGYSPDLHMAAYIQVGVLAVLFFFMMTALFRQQMFVPRSPLILALLAFYGWAMLSILWTRTKYEAVIDALDWSGAFFFAALVILILRELRYIKILLFFILLSGLLMALLGISQYLFGIDWVHQHIVPAATFANKNMAAQYGILTLPVAVAFFLRTRDIYAAWFYAITAALIMVCIFYARARGAWVGVSFEIVSLIALLAYHRLRHKEHFFAEMPMKKAVLAGSLALFLGISYLTSSMLGYQAEVLKASIGTKPVELKADDGLEVLGSAGKGAAYSAEKRFTIWANSLGMFRDHFLVGVGIGNWTIHYAKYQSLFKQDVELTQNKFHAHAHNDYVEILCELGLIGFVLFLWVIFTLARVVKGLLSSPDKEYALLTACLASILIGIGVNAIFSFPFKQPIPIFIILIYMAVLSNLYSGLSEKNRFYVFSLPPVPVKAVAPVLVLASVIGIFVFQVNLYKSELHYRHATASLEKGEFQKAYEDAAAAYELNPMRHILLWLQGTALMQLGKQEVQEEIVELFEMVERHYPYSSNALINLVAAYNRNRRYQESADSAERLLSVQPGNRELRQTYAVSLLNAGKPEKALEQFGGKVLPVRQAEYEEKLMWETRLQEEFDDLGNFPGTSRIYDVELQELHDKAEFIKELMHYIRLRQQARGG